MMKLSLAIAAGLIVTHSIVYAAEAEIRALAKVAPPSVRLTPVEVRSFVESVQMCWNPPAGATGKIAVKFSLDRTGKVIGEPQITGNPAGAKADELGVAAARRAVLRCQPYKLPLEKYEAWSEVIVNFASE